MINDTSLDRYEYGYLRGNGWGNNATGGTMYYGPPHSFWFNLLAVGIVSAAIAGAALSLYLAM